MFWVVKEILEATANRSAQGDEPHGQDHEHARLYVEDLTSKRKTDPFVSRAVADYGGTVGLERRSGHGCGNDCVKKSFSIRIFPTSPPSRLPSIAFFGFWREPQSQCAHAVVNYRAIPRKITCDLYRRSHYHTLCAFFIRHSN